MPDKQQQQQQPQTVLTAGVGAGTGAAGTSATGTGAAATSSSMTHGSVTTAAATADAGSSPPANGSAAGQGQEPQGQGQTQTAYERLTAELFTDQRLLKEVTLGRRIGFYKIRGELGSGNFSQVKMGVHNLTRDRVAIKIMDKTKHDQKTQRLLSREVASMERLHHPNVIRLYEVVETLAKLYIIMEYAGGGELFTKVSTDGRLDELLARRIYAQLVSAVDHVHQRGVIHRDIKAENVFFTSPVVVKIGDFGFSAHAQASQLLNTFCGSPPYAAPELFKDQHYDGRCVDVWALGVLLYFIVTASMPFRADTVGKLKKLILEGVYIMPSYVSSSCAALIRGILQPMPGNRLTLSNIAKSAWLAGEQLPAALPKYQLNPTVDSPLRGGGGLSEDEITARSRLNDLGIGDELLRQSSAKEARSSIIGTYRIMLHRVQRERDGYEPLGLTAADEALIQSRSATIDANGRRRQPGGGRLPKPSKLCAIL